MNLYPFREIGFDPKDALNEIETRQTHNTKPLIGTFEKEKRLDSKHKTIRKKRYYSPSLLPKIH